jgi:hypothetical protein
MDDKIKKNEMGGACGTYEEKGGEVHTGFWWGNLKQKKTT